MLIAQVSDIHATPGASSLAALERALVWLRDIRPSALIVSGDLADDHETGYGLVATLLAAAPCPVFAIPGNVDDKAALRRAFPRATYWPAAGPMNFSVELDGARLIGYDVTVADAHHGDAAPGLAWLGGELASGSSQPALIFTHQHLFDTGIARKDVNKCRNSDAVATLVAASPDPVVGFTCGHVHRAIFTRFAGRHATMCPSLAGANRLRLGGGDPAITDPPGLLVHDIGPAGMVSHVVPLG